MRIRHAFVSGCVLLLLFLPAVPSWACVCTASPSFDDSTRTQKASVVVVGRVLAVGTDSEGTLHRDDPAGVDVEIMWVAKGRVPATRVRIWNLWAGSSCGGALQMLPAGTQAAFALARADDERRRAPELWEALSANVPSTDFVLPIVCGDAVRILRSREEASRYVGKRIE